MTGHLRSSSDRIGKFSFDLIYSLTVKKSIYLLDIVLFNIFCCKNRITYHI